MTGEPALTKIYQRLPTVVGKKYELRYYFSPRPNTNSSQNTLIVRVAGAQVDSHTGSGGSNTSWTMYTNTFFANSTTTRIEFAGGGTADSLGVFLDNVSLRLMDCTSTPELVGQSCDGTWALTDLVADQQIL